MKDQQSFNHRTRHLLYALLSAVLIYGSWILLAQLFSLITNKIVEIVLTLISLPIIFYIWLKWLIARQKS